MPTADSLLKKFNDMKTLPHIGIRLSQMISNDNTSIQEFEKVIKMDPTLVLRLLRIANSSYYSARRKVESISEALVLVGMNNLRNMVVLSAIKDVFKKSTHEDIFSRSKLWLHSSAVSICSQMISERIFGKNGEDAFLCGILHDIGMIAEDQVETDLFIQICKTHDPEKNPIIDDETEIIGTNHCEVGSLLASDWKMPVEVQEGIKLHHSELAEVDPSSISGIIQISEYMATRLGYPAIPGMKAMLSPPLAKHMRDSIEEYKILTRDLPEEMQKAKEIYELDSE